MFRHVVLSCFLLHSIEAYSQNAKLSRRSFVIGVAPLIASAPVAALDIDAFINSELKSEKCDEKVDKKCKRELSDDEALCKFGSPSPETGEACLRAGMSTSRSGAVDAFGKVDRGDFVRCKFYYEDTGKTYVKRRTCQ